MRLPTLAAVLVLLLSSSLRAEAPKPIELILRPRLIESPPLKYQLLPSEAEIKPGNAVPILLRLPWEQTQWMSKVYPTLHEWNDRPLDAPEWKSSGSVLPERFFDEMKRAAFRRDAIWEYPIQETQTPYLILLPDVQGMRGFLGHGLSAKIRYHLSRGELEQAREGILVGLSNGRHIAQTPFYVNQLVAAAIHRIMLDRVAELIAQPDSPNLYWALGTLPDSLIELDRAASLEASVFSMTFPAVNDLDRPRDAEQWSKMAKQLVELLQQLDELPREQPPEKDASVFEQLLQRLQTERNPHLVKWTQHARAELPELLKSSEKDVAAMSDDEAAVRWYMHLRLTRDQRTAAALVQSPREAWPQLKQLNEEIKRMQDATGAKELPIFDPTSIYVSAWSLNRRIASLRIIEAVRSHLARNNGAWPRSLDEIREVAIPLDPLTGQAFQWKVDGKTAILKAPPLPADAVEPGSAADDSGALEYRLNLP